MPWCARPWAPAAALGRDGQALVIAVPYLWLLLFFLIPFVIVLKISFSDAQIAMPPYQPLFEWVGGAGARRSSSTSATSPSWSRTTSTGRPT